MMNVNTGQHFKDEKISVNNVFFFFFNGNSCIVSDESRQAPKKCA